jgi:hypothetical protein
MPKTVTRSKAPPSAKPAWKKPDPALVERFHAALPAHPEAQPKKMFGYPACFVNGNFFVGMHNDNFVIRLPEDLKAKFPELARAEGFDPMGTGKGMKDWWVLPTRLTRSTASLAAFFEKTFAEVRQLAPKVKKQKLGRAAGKKAGR